MTEETKKIEEVDIDVLSDEDFMKLDEPSEVVETKENTDAGTSSSADQIAADLAAKTAGGGDASEGAKAGDGEGGQEGGGSNDEGGDKEGGGGTPTEGGLTDEEQAAADTLAAEQEAAKTDEEKAAEAEAAKVAAAAEASKGANDDKETLTLKQENTTKSEVEAQELAKTQETAKTFFEKMSAPFKADGKDVQIRTPEEGIRLMQMGVNYSKRMEQMKPLRAMDAMLTAHGLNTPEQLNELIDLSKGSKEAIQKHLKKHNIDPLDLDPSKAGEYVTPNYQSDPKDVAFQYAIDTTLQAPGGKELLGDVNKDWDEESKEALREDPSIFGKLLEQKDNGVYSQIQTELLHQRTMGYLADVPFLQAYYQVGNAMQKAGVFDKKEVQKKTGMAPIGSGSRKVASKSQPNPNLSSAKITQIAAKNAVPTEPDYLSMSDEDFMNLAPPG